ncbi:uncharacterized protein UTRI_06197 [Ustilago trichophora]|uniref:Uncharacterized protein n=1 Tax=Ustilago trichophora TaxID=86804 RepID=A0A5C3EFH9_9BASI|nr:uncharacterized protein UTRI_06197 [Ustilago trichophora]
MLSFRLPLLLYTLLWLSVTCLIQKTCSTSGGSVNPITAPHPPDSDDLGKHASLMEELLRLPEGQLRPIYLVEKEQHPAASRHIANPDSQFIKLLFSETYKTHIMATPWITRHADGTDRNGVLFFNIDEKGGVIPTIHTGIRDDIQGRFWGLIKHRATMTQPELFRDLIDPLRRIKPE